MKVSFDGLEALTAQLIKKNKQTFDMVAAASLASMFNRASGPPYTPVDTRELVMSRGVTKPIASQNFTGEFGYIKDYSGHVEYGHRTRSGGYVPGQYYLKKNLEIERIIYKSKLIDEMRKE